MPAQQTGPRHAAPRDPARTRAVLLPSVLLVAAGAAFGGMAVLPASAATPPPRVTAAAAMAPVELAAPAPVANVELYSALSQGAVIADKPKPKPPVAKPAAPARPAAKASRNRAPEKQVSGARPGVGRLTSSYGRRWGRLHAGIDLAAGTGSPIRAAAAGTVLSARTESGYGRCIRIEHADGTVTVYAHNSALLVAAGERVEAGQLIAREGATGRVTGPHTHFEVRVNGTPINPVPWLRKRGVDI